MKTWILPFSILSVLSSSAHSGTPPLLKLRSSEALTTVVHGPKQRFTGSLKAGFHFNDKAPNTLLVDGKEQPLVSLNKQLVEFQLPSTWGHGKASLYVCDDAITYCETHSVEIKGEASASGPGPSQEKSSLLSKTSKPAKFGFIQDDFAKALSLARAQKKLVLVDFSARWCPGCVRYEKEVFSSPRFSKITKNVVKLKMDVDSFENFAQVEKWNIQGIPTLILMNAEEQEITRVIDYQSLESLDGFLKSAGKNPVSMKDLLANSHPTPAQSLQLGQRLLASGRSAESIPYFEKVSPPPPELLRARIEAAKSAFEADKTLEPAKKAYVKELKAALAKESESTRSIAWRSELVALLDPKSSEVKTLTAEGSAVAERCLKEPRLLFEAVKTDELGEFSGYEKLWVALLKADLVEAAGGSPEAITQAWGEAAKAGASYNVSAKRSGPALRYLIVLSSAKKFPEAETFANEILKHDPENTDVKRRKLKILLGLEKPEEAIKLGESILPKAEGRNEFWVAETLAKAYIAANRKSEAKRLLTAYLARPELNADKMKSSKKSLEDLLKSAGTVSTL
jgi:thioredoxin-like negative regulator of GroEL